MNILTIRGGDDTDPRVASTSQAQATRHDHVESRMAYAIKGVCARNNSLLRSHLSQTWDLEANVHVAR